MSGGTPTEGAQGFVCNTVTGGNAQGSLEGIASWMLQDGASAYVRSPGAEYRYSKWSTATPSAPDVILPLDLDVDDSGRWLIQSSSPSASKVRAHFYSDNFENAGWTSQDENTYQLPDIPGGFVANASSSDRFSINPETGEITYSGPSINCTVIVNLSLQTNTAPGVVTELDVFISKNRQGEGGGDINFESGAIATASGTTVYGHAGMNCTYDLADGDKLALMGCVVVGSIGATMIAQTATITIFEN